LVVVAAGGEGLQLGNRAADPSAAAEQDWASTVEDGGE
jgi:hypothetical protein